MKNKVLRTSRHAELVSASPNNQGIAGQARNDGRVPVETWHAASLQRHNNNKPN